ncbi:glycosyltransferase [Ancylobacter radicis]|uniref:Glycosyl transferase family 28 n=1 Tax=Ancylobacter radicis TaxID=2836179 RepID=A0ABS5R5S4_9HYPH|nr:glycosyltransferase [Ancylobacter radicis]MBS9477025.1 glycosyl transferase family 28 [Ancylobacter radicis]
MTTPHVMIAVTHLLGVGHLARMAAVGRALARAGWRVTIASGGRPAATVNTQGCTLVQLPPVHCVGTDFSTLYAAPGVLADAATFATRTDALLAAFDHAAPDVLITELYPLGRRSLAPEFDALLAHARSRQPRPVVLGSVRDVLNPPSRPERAEQALAKLGIFYDGVLFHGAAEVVPLGASWPSSPALERRLIETGYVHDGARGAEADSGTDGTDEILVSGGGSAAGLPLARLALQAATLLPERRWRVLVGTAVSPEAFAALNRLAPAHATVERARPDFPAVLARAALSVSQAGYNTVLDLAAAQARAILVPFAEGAEKEQTLRAGELAQRGLARVLALETLTAPALAEAARERLAAPRPDWSAIGRDGAARTAQVLTEQLARRRAVDAAWGRLDAVLAQARALGRMIDLWWRDDDAMAPTPALESLLARAARWQAPLTLAVIPARAQPALAARLSEIDRVDVAVHGFAHANHAPPTDKKAEFGAHRLTEVMIVEAQSACEQLKELFGSQFLPVFVPPWNRIAPDLLPALPGVGYQAVSTFRRRTAREAAPGLLALNTHWDPIDWKGGGGLADEAGLIDLMTDLIAGELAAAPGELEPIGLLTHHLVHDGWIDRFLDEMIDRLLASGAARFVSARAVIAAQAGRR